MEEAAAVEFGFAATAADAPGASDAELYRSLLDECEHNRSLGFSTAWALEHHFSDYFPTPDVMLLLGHIAARYPGLGLGTAVIVTPWHNPLRLAEQIAMLSVLSEGSLHLGLGRGTARLEFDAFGMDMEESRQRFNEAWAILQLALTGDPFTYAGEMYSAPREIRIRPRPNRERINFYGAIGSPESAGIMGRLGLPPICTSIGDFKRQAETLRTWAEAAADSGHSTIATFPILIECIVADTDDEAIALAREYKPRFAQAMVEHYQTETTDWENTKSYEAWKKIFSSIQARTHPENIDPWTAWQLIGSPETVVRKARMFMAAGFNHFILHFATPGVPRSVRREWANRFAHEVAPELSPAFGRPVVASG